MMEYTSKRDYSDQKVFASLLKEKQLWLFPPCHQEQILSFKSSFSLVILSKTLL